ncbi:hypothetical protein ACSAZL_04200 [Methanosarcina sp. T3]
MKELRKKRDERKAAHIYNKHSEYIKTPKNVLNAKGTENYMGLGGT